MAFKSACDNMIGRRWTSSGRWRDHAHAVDVAAARPEPVRSTAGLPEPAAVYVSGTLADLGAVPLVLVADEQAGRQFRAMMAWHNPEGEPR